MKSRQSRILQILFLLWILTSLLTVIYNNKESQYSAGVHAPNFGPLHPQQQQREATARLQKYSISSGNKAADIVLEDLPDYKLLIEPKRGRNVTRTQKKDSCVCVKCWKDAKCGRLWDGNQAYGKRVKSVHAVPVHLVISYCKGDLSFIGAMTEGYNIATIHIISKCGHAVKGLLPKGAVVEVLPNVGRCDHSYAYYITSVLDQKLNLRTNGTFEDDLVVFLKDNAGARNLHQSGRWNSFSDMVDVASSRAGFACGLIPGNLKKNDPIFDLSAHYEVASLRQFNISEYGSRSQYDGDNVTFNSEFDNLGEMYDHIMKAEKEVDKREIVQVCFGGVFAASVKKIKQQKMEVWKAIEQRLSRGDNIQEGHFVERMWGTLLASPLESYQLQALKEHSDYVLRPGYSKFIKGSESVVGAVAAFFREAQRLSTGEKCGSTRHCWPITHTIKRRRKFGRFQDQQ